MTRFMQPACHHSRPVIKGTLVFAAVIALITAITVSFSYALAQSSTATPQLAQSPEKPIGPVVSAKSPVTPLASSKPAWRNLTPAQQLSLTPLAAKWDILGEAQKRKWIAIAANYPNLSPPEQAKLHSRMTEWVSLSQQQRSQARLNFAESKQLTPSQKTATWEAYQALSPEEKMKLAVAATPKPAGAAIATKPVSPKKLATVPLTIETPKDVPNISASRQTVSRKTLLPHAQPPAQAASAPGL